MPAQASPSRITRSRASAGSGFGIGEVAVQSVAVINRHQLVWRDPPAWPFVWRGLLPLLVLLLAVLFALGPFARSAIEGVVQRELRSQLDDAGFSWVALSVAGQNVTLSGEEPSATAGQRALALAQTALCPTWSGRRTCAVQAVGHFSAPLPVAAGTVAPSQAAAEACERALASALKTEQIEFASGSAAIDARSAPLLDQLAREARTCPGAIRIEGHTDTIGRTAFNRSLSEARAAAVRDALIARGIPAERLQAQGFGAARPVADNRTDSGRALNRRIEFHAVAAAAAHPEG
jgi:outer membrane protein OmpA-like peptidoglycan-associated protein